MSACAIYVIAHPESGKCYVGSSVNVSSRWKRHCAELRKGAHHSHKLQAVGSDQLVFSIVETTDAENRHLAEQHWMNLLGAVSDGFNVCPTAGTPSTLPKTAEHKARIGNAHRGMKRSPEAKDRMSAAMSGKKRKPTSPETAAKISAAKKGRPMSDQAKSRLSAAKKGVKTGPISDERKAAMSVAKRARDLTAKEFRA